METNDQKTSVPAEERLSKAISTIAFWHTKDAKNSWTHASRLCPICEELRDVEDLMPRTA